MPGPSFAPVFAAVGAFLLFLGLVFGGLILLLGAIALALDAAVLAARGDCASTTTTSARPRRQLPAVVHDGPPPGVHMPGPSFRPFLGALGVALLMLGLVFGGWLLAAGVIALIVDARRLAASTRPRNIAKVEEADETGHLENLPDAAHAVAGPRGARRPGRRGRAAPDGCASARPGGRRRAPVRRRAPALRPAVGAVAPAERGGAGGQQPGRRSRRPT